METVNFNLYHIFYEVAKSSSFSEASERLYISQPAISKNIKNLEEILQTKLFYRKNKGIVLTRNGEKLLSYVEKAYSFLTAGQKIILENNDLSTGQITIGCPSHIAEFYLLKYIELFRKDYPGINIKISSLSTRDLIKELQQHQIDFIIDSSPIDSIYNNMIIKPIKSFETCFICNSDSLKSLEDIKNLEDFDLILPLERSSVRKNLEKTLKEYNVNLNAVLEVETTNLIISSVKHDIGVGYVVKEAVKEQLDKGIIYEAKTNCELPKLELNLIYVDNYLSNTAKRFIDDYIKI